MFPIKAVQRNTIPRITPKGGTKTYSPPEKAHMESFTLISLMLHYAPLPSPSPVPETCRLKIDKRVKTDVKRTFPDSILREIEGTGWMDVEWERVWPGCLAKPDRLTGSDPAQGPVGLSSKAALVNGIPLLKFSSILHSNSAFESFL